MEEKNSFRFAEEQFCEMTDFLKNKQSHDLELSELENHIKHDGRELMRRLLTGHLEERGTGDIGFSVIGADGINRNHKRIITRTVKTIFGHIEIKRLGYFSRNSSSLFPLDAMLNLPVMNISYVLQKNLVLEVIKSSFDESVLSIERWAHVKIPKRQAKKVIINAAKDFEEFYNHKKTAEKPSAIRKKLMILTSDGKGVVMLYCDLREQTKKRASKQNGSDKFTRPKKSNSKRMATVASVYEIDRFIRKPKDIHPENFGKLGSCIKNIIYLIS